MPYIPTSHSLKQGSYKVLKVLEVFEFNFLKLSPGKTLSHINDEVLEKCLNYLKTYMILQSNFEVLEKIFSLKINASAHPPPANLRTKQKIVKMTILTSILVSSL